MKRSHKYLLVAGLAIVGAAAATVVMQQYAEKTPDEQTSDEQTSDEQTPDESQAAYAHELYQKGAHAYFLDDYETAFPYLKQAAEMGHAKAQWLLGMCYLNGKSTQQDANKAFEWFYKSAMQGEPGAQFKLAQCYHYGWGTQIDFDKAVEWYQKCDMLEQVLADAIPNQESITHSIPVPTIYDIVVDDKPVAQIHSQYDIVEDDRAIGAVDVSDGIDDATKATISHEVVTVQEPIVEDIVYTVANVQEKPEFPGGERALYQWLSENIVYPESAAEDGVEGRVVVGFTVSKKGAIENVKVIRGKHPALDKEAIRVVESMPKWNPGRYDGKPVKVDYTLPVTFKLQRE